MTAVHFLNGKFVGEDELVVPVRDLGFARGYAVFDFLITYHGGSPFMLARHTERLFNSARIIGLALPWTEEEVSSRVMETLAKNADGGEKAIKIIASGGISGSLMPQPGTATLAILVDPLHLFPADYYEKGISVITDKHMRYAPGAKTNNYIEGVKQVQIAQESGSLEPIYYDDSQVFEATSSNVWAVIDGTLMTPKSNILEGITREVLLKILKLDSVIPVNTETCLCGSGSGRTGEPLILPPSRSVLPAKTGFCIHGPVQVADFPIEKLRGASEVFLTASNKEVMPVVRIDGTPVGAGIPGPVTREVMRQFRAFTDSDLW